MLPWVAKVGSNRSKLASFSIAKYGAQTGADYSYFPDAGNGILTSGSFVPNNDPNDANVANSTSMQQEWAQHLVQKWGNASGNGPRYYILDNEHSIWHQTHRYVHPVGARMDEVRDLMINYAAALKGVRRQRRVEVAACAHPDRRRRRREPGLPVHRARQHLDRDRGAAERAGQPVIDQARHHPGEQRRRPADHYLRRDPAEPVGRA